MSLSPGTRIGVYEITTPLGAGGMGEVYRAKDSKLKREVALKVLPADVATDRERMARFQREAEVLASLNHPNIAHIHGLEESNGTTALVMELVEGEDLAERLKRGAIPIDEALPIAKQIAEALEAAHDAGIIHRDLKPANIKVRPDGTVKVLDFGLAKALDQGSGIGDQGSGGLANSPTITSPAMTMHGMILGTAAYMAPEQAKGKAVDKRADIWAFGVVLFEMLTGTRAFKGDDVTDIITSVMRDTPDWKALPVTTPGAIRTLLRRCLEKDPRQRAPHIAVARLEIGDAMLSTGEPVPSAAPPAPRTLAFALPIALTVAALAGGWAWGRWSAPAVPDAAPLRFQIDGPLASQFSQRVTAFLSVSPDGKYVAYVGQQRGRITMVWLHSLSDGTARELENTKGATSVFWSPDSRFVAFQAGKQLQRVDIATGAVQVIAESTGGGNGSWNQDGVILLADVLIQRVPAGGGTPEPITTLDSARGDIRHTRPHFLPDGRRFTFTAVNADGEKTTLRVGELGSTETRILADIASGADYVAPGYLVYAKSSKLMARPFDAETAQWSGDPIMLATTVRQQALGPASFSASVSGVLAYDPNSLFGTDLELVWIGRDGRPAGTFAAIDGGHTLALAPDDRSVAVEQDAGESGNAIWLLDGDRGTRSRFTFDKGAQGHPLWSPDGARLAYFNGQPGSITRLWFRTATGTGNAEPLMRSGGDGATTKQVTDWSRDGRLVVFEEQSRETGWDVKFVDLTGDRRPVTLLSTPFNERLGQLSPDGRWIAYESNETGQSEIYVATFPDGSARWAISSRGGAKPRWNANGREIVFIDALGTLQSVAITSSDGFRAGVAAPLFALGGIDTDGYNYAVARDGTRFLVMRPSANGSQPRMSVIVNWPASLAR